MSKSLVATEKASKAFSKALSAPAPAAPASLSDRPKSIAASPSSASPSFSLLLHRDAAPSGFAMVLHEFSSAQSPAWEQNLGKDRVVLCLNLSGRGTIGNGPHAIQYHNRTIGFFFTGNRGIKISRQGEEDHSFITLSWDRRQLTDQLKESRDQLSPEIRPWISPRSGSAAASALGAMGSQVEQLYQELRTPPLHEAARPLWYQGKALELLALFAFQAKASEEFFCSRQKRMAQERVERTMQILQEHLVDPPDLETLGSRVGCSPFYLSRLFSKEMKVTIPQYVRELRMVKSAELLRSGRYNVTEAALEVGYNSLSHFSKAFWERFGCCPGLYPQGAKLFSRRA